jgi:predicted phosphodiesterase
MIAIIADVHANLQAFRAVLDDAERHRVDEFWCLGDMVDYGANPNEVVELAKAINITRFVGGNHDAALFRSDVPASVTPHGIAAHAFTVKALLPENAGWLKARCLAEIDEPPDCRITLVHGTPADPHWGHLRPGRDPEEWMAVREGTDFTTLLVGHSHLQFEEDAGRGRKIVNPGSVGQPRNNCNRAQYMLYDGHSMIFRAVEYDIAAAARAIFSAGLPEILGNRLFDGR